MSRPLHKCKDPSYWRLSGDGSALNLTLLTYKPKPKIVTVILLFNGMPCIYHLGLQWYHVLIKLHANSMIAQYESYGYDIPTHYSLILLDAYTTTDQVWLFWLESKMLW